MSKLVHINLPPREKSWFWSKCRGFTVLISISVFTFHLNASITGTLTHRISEVGRFRKEPAIALHFQRQEWVPFSKFHGKVISWAKTRSQCFETKPGPFPPYPATSPRAEGQCVERWPAWHISSQRIRAIHCCSPQCLILTLGLFVSHSTHCQWESSLIPASTVIAPKPGPPAQVVPLSYTLIYLPASPMGKKTTFKVKILTAPPTLVSLPMFTALCKAAAATLWGILDVTRI